MHINRRDFLKNIVLAAAGLPFVAGLRAVAEQIIASGKTVTIYVVHGKDIPKMLAEGMTRLGGWKSFVKPGKKAVLKPNAAWGSRPEQGGNTHPELVRECAAACLTAFASEVVIPENPCTEAATAFPMSGIEEAVKKAGGRIYCPRNEDYEGVSLPAARILKRAEVVRDVLHAECLINMPVAKSHSGATLTLSMKNWMGSVRDRGFWHKNGLHQCIADCSTLIKPSLIILDATRILLTHGPRGPGKLAYPEQIIFGCDPVAVDAYAATLFKKEPFDIPYIKIAHEMGIGCGDLSKVNVIHLNT